MPSRRLSYADLDLLLTRLGFKSQAKDMPRYGLDPNDGSAAVQVLDRPPIPVLLYRNTDGASIVLPQRLPGDPVEPRHLVPTRRQLIERGLIAEEEFDRWLCGVRFGDVCREPVTTGASDRQNGRATG